MALLHIKLLKTENFNRVEDIGMNTAAVILCAGKGTRMNDDSLNKVCFPCAGVPVIRRIVTEMQAGGVDRFVIVVGH